MTDPDIHQQLEERTKTLAALEAQRDATSARLAAIVSEREGVSHSALTGNAEARAALLALKREAAELIDGLTDIASAINQATRDIEKAEEAIEALGRRREAEGWLSKADAFETEGKAAREALTAFVDAFGRMQRVGDTLRSNGATEITGGHMASLMRRAVQTKLMQVGLQVDFVAPSERVDIDALTKTWADNIRRRARREIEAANIVVGAGKTRRAA